MFSNIVIAAEIDFGPFAAVSTAFCSQRFPSKLQICVIERLSLLLATEVSWFLMLLGDTDCRGCIALPKIKLEHSI